MTETASPWQVTVYALIAQPGKAQVLLQPSQAGYALPAFAQEQEQQWLRQQQALEALQTMTGADLALLRYVLDQTVEEERRVDALMEFELLSRAETVRGEWIDADHLAQIPLAQPEFRTQIEAFLAEKAGGSAPSLRAPWAKPGWYAQMRSWISAQLASIGEGNVDRIEVVRTWALSSVLRVRTTTQKTFYFKATVDIPLFGNEGLVTAELARHFPAEVPMPLAVDGPRRWMLLAPFEGDVEHQAPLESRLRLMRAFAEIQVQSSRLIDDLIAAGCLDRRLGWTAAQIDPLLTDNEFLKLDDAELARWRELAPLLKQRCRQIEEFKVPATLVHGDLHTGNVAFRVRRLHPLRLD